MNLQRGIRFAGLGMLFAGSVVFAQSSSDDVGSSQPLTRAEVRQQVIDLKAVGYRPEITNNTLYPNDLHEAQRRLACKQNVQANSGGQAAWAQQCNIVSTITIVNP